MAEHIDDIDSSTRARIRSIRRAHGWSLDELARRSHLSASTISRIETGGRTISLDVLVALARALGTDVNTLLDANDDSDVVIRPTETNWPGATAWPLSRATSATAAVKVRLEPSDVVPETRVHLGHDWLYVLSGRIELLLGERRIIVESGEAAEFSTLTPHAIRAIDTTAELIMVFDPDGRRSHLHTDAPD